MKDIQALRKEYFDKLIKKYISSTTLVIEDNHKEYNDCMIVAETLAYLDIIIPEEHRKYTIFDFKGKTDNGEKVLDKDVALRGKDLVCKYCWGLTWQDMVSKFKSEDNINKYIQQNSMLMRRLKQGSNVAIFGQSIDRIGRTFLASIILKEAIKLRLKVQGVRGQTYDWVDFSVLKKALVEDKGEGKGEGTIDYKAADWLVVDNIIDIGAYSPAQKTLMTDAIDPFFLGRLKNKLPTILVFKFDIRDDTIELDKKVGAGITRILNNVKTCKIPLSKKLLR
jgi:hypothetical protein